METMISVDPSVMVGINGPCMTVSMEDIGVVSTVYTLRQLVLPADETCSMYKKFFGSSIQHRASLNLQKSNLQV